MYDKTFTLVIAMLVVMYMGLEAMRLTMVLSKAANKRSSYISESAVPEFSK